MKVYLYQRFTDYWGPIPYSQVNNNQRSVAYDAQKDIYADFFVQLDSATTTFAAHAGENAFGPNDQIYGGDVNKWLVFANTLRLRIAMRLSTIDASTAKTQAEKAVAAGVMTTNDQRASLSVTNASPNPLPIMLPWNEFRMSATMESILKGFNDPRLAAYWGPTVNSVTAGTPIWRGMRNGLSVPQQSDPSRAYDNISTMATRWSDPNNQGVTPWDIMLPSEAFFLRAEGALKGWNMGGITAQDAYNQGIAVSLSYWGATAAQIAAYQAGMTTPIALPDFATPPQSNLVVAYDPTRAMEQIMTQKWLALFPDGWEAWAECRRTEFPTLYPVINSDDPLVPPAAYMRRIEYGPSEYNNNTAAVNAAVATLGGPDASQTRLWWNPAK
jgi:Susd and RagB outer membrane lipoprotein